MGIQENLRLSLLVELYGNLLTEKQHDIVCDYLDNNLSLTELAEVCKTSRQAINDLVKRTFKVLEEYEAKLGLLQKFTAIKSSANKIVELSTNLADGKELSSLAKNILEVL